MKYIQIGQLIAAILLTAAILLQKRGAGTSAFMGGGGASYYTKRGIEKYLFYGTIILAVIFLVLGTLNLILNK